MDVTVDFVCTLRAQSNHPPLIFDARGNGGGGIAPTITGDHQNRVTDYTAIVVTYEENISEHRLRMVESRGDR